MTHSRLRPATRYKERPCAQLLEFGLLIVPDQFLKVKAGATNWLEFACANGVFPTTHCAVLTRFRVRNQQPSWITLEDLRLRPRGARVPPTSSQSAS